MRTLIPQSLLLLSVLAFGGCSTDPMHAESLSEKQAMQHTILHGKLSMRGSGHTAHLELITDHGSYRITNPNAFGLMQQQNRSVHLKVRLVKKAIGPGFPAEVEVISVF